MMICADLSGRVGINCRQSAVYIMSAVATVATGEATVAAGTTGTTGATGATGATTTFLTSFGIL